MMKGSQVLYRLVRHVWYMKVNFVPAAVTEDPHLRKMGTWKAVAQGNQETVSIVAAPKPRGSFPSVGEAYNLGKSG